MTRYTGEIVGRWLYDGKHNEPDINRLCVLPDDEASLEAHRAPDDMPPDPAVGVWGFNFDEKTAEQLQADPDFVVLWIEAVHTDEVAEPGDVVRAPAIGPDAVEKKPPDVVPPASERAALTTRLVAMGLRGVDLAAIITAQNARGVAAEKLKALCKEFPKAKV